jgi:hypothetical protein
MVCCAYRDRIQFRPGVALAPFVLWVPLSHTPSAAMCCP